MSTYIEKISLDNKHGFDDRFNVIHEELIETTELFESDWKDGDLGRTKNRLMFLSTLCKGFAEAIEERGVENDN